MVKDKKEKRNNKKSNLMYRKIFFVPPPFIPVLKEKFSIDRDPNFRKQVTEFFLKKVKKWMKNYKAFKHTKKNLKKINSKNGYDIVYKLLRSYCKKYDVKWYFLRSELYNHVKDFLRYELGNID